MIKSFCLTRGELCSNFNIEITRLHKNKLFFYHTESLENTLISNPIVAIKTDTPEVLTASHHLSEPQVLFSFTRLWRQRREASGHVPGKDKVTYQNRQP